MSQLNKTQRKIIIAAALLILIALLFPPYKECPFNDKGEWTGKCYIKWAFSKEIKDLYRNTISISKSTFSSGMKYEIMEINYPLMRGLLLFEVLGILVLAGAALLIIKSE